MKKILISSLGTGDRDKGYKKTNYQIDKELYKEKKSIAQVLCNHLHVDKLFLIGTMQSIWEVVYSEFGGIEKEEEIYYSKETGNLQEFLPLIEKQIDKTLKTDGSKCFIIEYGKNEQELWRNFDIFLTIAKDFTKDDEIHLDITHSFRSLSLMSFVMSEFISNSQNTPLNIKGVYYGMLEFARENNGIAPIVELSMFFELLEWSKAIRNLKIYGNSYELLRLINNTEESNELKNSFANFSMALSMSDMNSMQSSIKILKSKIELFKTHHNNIYRIISEELEDFVKRLHVNSLSVFQYELSKWYAENKNYAFSYISLCEAIVSSVCENENLNPQNYDDRKKAKEELNYFRDQKKASKSENKINEIYYKVKNIRNSIAHILTGDAKKTKITTKDAINNLSLYINNEYIKELFKNKN